jgi:para-aminobenzoate synthetase/4-amino-4-deoxychorismate lyase
MRSEPLVRFDALGPGSSQSKSFVFADYQRELRVDDPAQVAGALEQIEHWARDGGHAAGYLSYEAATGLEPAAAVHGPSGSMPLMWFGLFGRRIEIAPLANLDVEGGSPGKYELSNLHPTLDFAHYTSAIDKVQDYILAGDSYQVNFTQRLRGTLAGDVHQLYADLCLNQRASYCALIELEEFAILSASPELFFAVRDGELHMRPMKGTSRRGRWLEEDEQMACSLRASPKDCAENVMIVDLIRNDLGRISELGSVTVENLWELERYETVWQMTSGVRSRCRPEVSLAQLFAALFPSGSVTGAPKIRTMEIIAELEDSPRGVYTGAIGFVSPRTTVGGVLAPAKGVLGLESTFNVAIRTLCMDRRTGAAESGIGGGITHYSNAQDEYDEALLKARFLTRPAAAFELVETLLCTEEGYFLLEKHLRRLQSSADYFAFPCSREAVETELLTHQAAWSAPGHHRVRLTLSATGVLSVESQPLQEPNGADHWPVQICERAIDRDDVFLYHKTTRRQAYEERLRDYPHCRDVILCNEAGEVTECCIGNLVLDVDGRHLTPVRTSGLLAGVFRDHLLETGVLHECVLSVADVRRAQRVFMINSVRKWVELTLVGAGTEHIVPSK